MCPNSKAACECQPQDGLMCPHGPTPPFKPWPCEVDPNSSRCCERGTKGCTVAHGVKEVPDAQP